MEELKTQPPANVIALAAIMEVPARTVSNRWLTIGITCALYEYCSRLTLVRMSFGRQMLYIVGEQPKCFMSTFGIFLII